MNTRYFNIQLKVKFITLTLLFFCLFNSQNSFSQSVSGYTFSASSGSYSTISATGTSATNNAGNTNAFWNDGYFNSLPIGFTFNFGGANYTTFSASTNGWMTFGQTISSSTPTNALNGSATAIRPLVAPLWDDLSLWTCGQLYYSTTGSAGSQVCTIEWYGAQWNSAAGCNIGLQVKLYETSNLIVFDYQQYAGAVNSGSASIGIGGVSATDYWSLNGTGTSPSASSSSETNSLSSKPAIGQLYSWTPASCSAAPTTNATSLAFSSVACTGMTVGCTAGNGTSRIIVAKAGSAVAGTPTNNSTYTANANFTSGNTIAAGEYVVYNGSAASPSVAITGLTAGTTYYFKVFEYNCTAGNEKYYTGGTPLNGNQAANPLPSAAGAITGSLTSMCNTGTSGVSFSATAITNATGYTWAYSGTGFSITGGTNSNSITASFSSSVTAGNLTVTGTNTCGSGTISANYAITVISGLPTQPVCSEDQYLCGAYSKAVTLTVTNPGTGSWSILNGPGTVSTPSSANASGAQITGSGTVTYRWTSTNGCGSIYDDVVIVGQ